MVQEMGVFQKKMILRKLCCSGRQWNQEMVEFRRQCCSVDMVPK